MSNLTKELAPVVALQQVGPVFDLCEEHKHQMKSWTPEDGGPGYIMGTAIHFIPWQNLNLGLVDDKPVKDTVQRIGVNGPWPHDYAMRGLEGHGYMVGATDDRDTQYGFVTTNGFFVDRVKACEIWREMLVLAEWQDPSFDKYKNSLYSYDLKPEVIDHCYKLHVDAMAALKTDA